MSASYPTTFKSFSAHVDYTETIIAQHVNDLQDEVMAIEQTLGTSPNTDTTGTIPKFYATVLARLDALAKETEHEAFLTTLMSPGGYNVPPSTFQYMNFTTSAVDTHTLKSSGNAATCKRKGWYVMTATLYISPDTPAYTSTPWVILGAIDVNGGTVAVQSTTHSANDHSGNYINLTYSGPWSVGNNVQVKMWQNSNQKLGLITQRSTFSVIRIRDL
jgi:hypothetical protein